MGYLCDIHINVISMGYAWDIDGVFMQYFWDIDGVLMGMGYARDINEI